MNDVKKRAIIVSIFIFLIIFYLIYSSINNTTSKENHQTETSSVTPTSTATAYKTYKECWSDLSKKYPLVSYEKLSKHKDSFVFIDVIIDNVSYDDTIEWLEFDMYIKTNKKGKYYLETYNTINYSEEIGMKQMYNLKNGYTLRLCMFVNSDGSFGSNVIAIKILNKKAKKISSLKTINSIKEETKLQPIYSLRHNELLEVTENGSTLIIKAKIDVFGKDNIISSAFFDVMDVIDTVETKYDEIQYWAVCDMANRTEAKAISFTLDKKTIKKVHNGKISERELRTQVKDLYIHESLR